MDARALFCKVQCGKEGGVEGEGSMCGQCNVGSAPSCIRATAASHSPSDGFHVAHDEYRHIHCMFFFFNKGE